MGKAIPRAALYTLYSLCGLSLGVSALAGAPVATDNAILHVLNRVAFGPTAGDLERVRAEGVARYIDDQLHPERLTDARMDARLAGLETLHMSSREIAERFEIPLLLARRARQAAANDKDRQDQANPANQEDQRPANKDGVELTEQEPLP